MATPEQPGTLVTRDGEQVSILADPTRVAEYLEELQLTKQAAADELRRVERLVIEAMDAALLAKVDGDGVSLEKDPPDHSKLEWDHDVLARLYQFAPSDPALAEQYRARVDEALRPSVKFQPLMRELRKLGRELPQLEGTIADAEQRRPMPRHVRPIRAYEERKAAAR